MIYIHCRWFNKHLKEFGNWNTDEERVSIVLLTNDHGNKLKARDEGIEVYTGIVSYLLKSISVLFVVIKCEI